MNSRRKFLLHGSLATAALMITKPFTSVANTLEATTGFSMQHNHVSFVYPGKYTSNNISILQDHISKMKSNWSSPVLLQASSDEAYEGLSVPFDATVNVINSTDPNVVNDHCIVTKGNIKTGVITVTRGEKNIVKRVNDLAAFLKNEKNCQVVVCLSQLGYKTKRGLDDVRLASSSKGVDMIIGGHQTNYFAHPVIWHNKLKEEIIIHSAVEKNIAFGSIAFEFNNEGQKRNVAIHHELSKVA